MNLALSALYRLCCGETQSNRNVRERLEARNRFAPLSSVLALLLVVAITSPVATQPRQTATVAVRQAVQAAVEKNPNYSQGEMARAREERRQVEARALEAGIRNELDAPWRQYDTARALLTRIEGEMLDKARRALALMEFYI